MIPFFQPGPIEFPFLNLEFHWFGILVGTAVVAGSWSAQKRAETQKLNPRVVADLALWVVIMGFIFAHLISLFGYFPERVFGTPCADALGCVIDGETYTCGSNGRCNDGSWLEVFRIWDGISSLGGFFGAFVGIITFFQFKRIIIIPKVLELVGGKGRPAIKYMDAIGYGFVFGWIFGRLGCFVAHDHVGIPSEFFLAVNFPDGWRQAVPAVAGIGADGFTPRFDLGLMETFWAVTMTIVFRAWARTKELRPGWFGAVIMMSYGPYRLFLDTLRATDIGGADKRYFASETFQGLTVGQFGSIIVFFLGLLLWWIGGRLAKDANYVALTDVSDVEAFSSVNSADDDDNDGSDNTKAS